MTHTAVADAQFVEGDFRVGGVISRSIAVLSRHFLTFFIVALIAYLPILLEAGNPTGEPTDMAQALSMMAWGLLSLVLLVALSTLGQTTIVHAAFQDVRRRPFRLTESLNVSWRRFLPIIGLSLIAGFLTVLALLLLIIPGFILYTMWFVGFPVCVFERLGPWRSLRRSQELTKGHRWKILGLALLIIIPSLGSLAIAFGLSAVAGPMAGLIGKYIWGSIWAACAATIVAVTYHDLRVAKEGVDIDRVAGVFD